MVTNREDTRGFEEGNDKQGTEKRCGTGKRAIGKFKRMYVYRLKRFGVPVSCEQFSSFALKFGAEIGGKPVGGGVFAVNESTKTFAFRVNFQNGNTRNT
jgi:hypothetical protein